MPLAIYLTVIQGLILISMLKVLTTNPGILPQITYRYIYKYIDARQIRICLKYHPGNPESNINTSYLKEICCILKNIVLSVTYTGLSGLFTARPAITVFRGTIIIVLGCQFVQENTTISRNLITKIFFNVFVWDCDFNYLEFNCRNCIYCNNQQAKVERSQRFCHIYVSRADFIYIFISCWSAADISFSADLQRINNKLRN